MSVPEVELHINKHGIEVVPAVSYFRPTFAVLVRHQRTIAHNGRDPTEAIFPLESIIIRHSVEPCSNFTS